MYVPWLLNFIQKINYLPPLDGNGRHYVLYFILVTKFSDTGAYAVGSLIGRHKMIPRISPGKTWEGFVGALVLSTLASVGFAALAGDWGRRAAWAAIAYTLFFGVVGQPFNQFWGALIAPLFCFGAAQGTAAAIDLVRAARLPHATWSSEEAVI